MKLSEAPRYARWVSWFPISITRHLITFYYWMEFHKPIPEIDQGGEGEKDAQA